MPVTDGIHKLHSLPNDGSSSQIQKMDWLIELGKYAFHKHSAVV